MSIELNDNEVEVEEIAGEQSIRLDDLAKMIPVLQTKYGVKSVIRFTGVAIAPSSKAHLRGAGYGK